MLKAIKFLVGICLIPACVAVSRAGWMLVCSLHTGDRILPVAGMALLGGFAVWVVVFFVLPRPFRSYVLAHELTHAVWAILMGARVSGIKVGKNHGSVELSKSNVLITLAPYFFPLYTVIVVLAFGIGSVFVDLSDYTHWWLAAVGFTWGFHFTFTITVLTQHQSDIVAHGRLFSYSLIYLFNILGILIWVSMVTEISMKDVILGMMSEFAWQAEWAWPYIMRLKTIFHPVQ